MFSSSSSVDATVLRVDDIYQRETQNRSILQHVDRRLQLLEDLNVNMYQMIEKMFVHQSTDGQDALVNLHRRVSYSDDDAFLRRQRRGRQQRRRSSLFAEYQTNRTKDFSSFKPRHSNQSQQRLSVHRLNSSTSSESNITRIQSNEYTSITDGLLIFFLFSLDLTVLFFLLAIDTTQHQWQSTSPRLTCPVVTADDSTGVFESTREGILAAYDAEEQTHHLIGEMIRRRTRKSSINPTNLSLESYCDSDRTSLLSIDINTSSSNLNLSVPDAKD